MAICEMHFWSNALEMQSAATIIVPQGVPGPWPVLYLLHGLSDDHTMWTRNTSIERYVANMGLMVVMPNGGRGWYVDAADLPKSRYESLITEDLVGFVDSTFPTQNDRTGRVIAGLSMGGYGAFKIALHRPDLFSAAVSHSGAVHFGSQSAQESPTDRRPDFLALFGSDPRGGPNDIYALLRNSSSEDRPKLRLDCGTDDFLIEQNRTLHRFLTGEGIVHEYAEHPGGHDWGYWNFRILDTLTFFSKSLALKFPREDHIYLP